MAYEVVAYEIHLLNVLEQNFRTEQVQVFGVQKLPRLAQSPGTAEHGETVGLSVYGNSPCQWCENVDALLLPASVSFCCVTNYPGTSGSWAVL